MDADKTHKLTLNNTTLREEEGYHDMIENPDDPLCVVRLFKLFKAFFPDPYVDFIFRRPAKQTDSNPYANGPDLGKNGKAGRNQLTKITKAVALRCTMSEVDRNTGGGRRQSGITQMACAGEAVPTGEMLTSARHKSIEMNAHYHPWRCISSIQDYIR